MSTLYIKILVSKNASKPVTRATSRSQSMIRKRAKTNTDFSDSLLPFSVLLPLFSSCWNYRAELSYIKTIISRSTSILITGEKSRSRPKSRKMEKSETSPLFFLLHYFLFSFLVFLFQFFVCSTRRKQLQQFLLFFFFFFPLSS